MSGEPTRFSSRSMDRSPPSRSTVRRSATPGTARCGTDCSRRSTDSAASASCGSASSPAPAPVFSAGADLADPAIHSTEDISEYDEGQDNSLYDALQRCGKPVIAAINGSAHGAGATLALACDLRVMADDAFMVWPMARLGMIPANGTLVRMARLIGSGQRARHHDDRAADRGRRGVSDGAGQPVVPAAKLLDGGAGAGRDAGARTRRSRCASSRSRSIAVSTWASTTRSTPSATGSSSSTAPTIARKRRRRGWRTVRRSSPDASAGPTRAASRRTRRLSLPISSRGSSVTRSIERGHLKCASRSRIQSISSRSRDRGARARHHRRLHRLAPLLVRARRRRRSPRRRGADRARPRPRRDRR